MTNLIQEFGKITNFIETLNTSEMIQLWQTVNTAEYISLISNELSKNVAKEVKESLEGIANPICAA